MRRCSAGTCRPSAFDWPVLRDNVLAEVGRLEGLYEQTLGNNKVEIFHERADDRRAQRRCGWRAGGRSPPARSSSPPARGRSCPTIEGIEHAISSNEVFHLETMPKRIVIAGGGYIANEFAGIFHQFGAHVTLVNRSRRDPARL